MSIDVNYFAVLVGGIVAMVLGFLWYGPVFGQKWRMLMNFTPESMAAARARGMGKSYALMFVGALVMAYVLWHTIGYASGFMQESGAWVGIQGAFWVWLGFIMPVMLGKVLWESKPWALFVLDAGYYLVDLVVMGAIMGAWM